MKTQAELNKIAQEQEEARREAMLKQQQSMTGEHLNQTPVVRETIHADDEGVLHVIMMAYKKSFSKEAWYEEPKINKDGHLSLSFKDEATATAFAEEQSRAGHKFVLVNAKTGKVKGYSDGTAFHKNSDNKSLEEIESELGRQGNRPSM